MRLLALASPTASWRTRIAKNLLQRHTGRAPLKKRKLPVPLFPGEVEVIPYPEPVPPRLHWRHPSNHRKHLRRTGSAGTRRRRRAEAARGCSKGGDRELKGAERRSWRP